MRMWAGLIGAIVAALLVVWLINRPSDTAHDAPSMPAPAAKPLPAPVEPPPAATQPANEPVPVLPELPPYLEIVDSLAAATPRIESTVSAPNAIDLKTVGVRRLRLLRSEWPHRVTTSIAVRIDGQGIEWTGKRDVLELERSDNGDWAILPPAAPDRP